MLEVDVQLCHLDVCHCSVTSLYLEIEARTDFVQEAVGVAESRRIRQVLTEQIGTVVVVCHTVLVFVGPVQADIDVTCIAFLFPDAVRLGEIHQGERTLLGNSALCSRSDITPCFRIKVGKEGLSLLYRLGKFVCDQLHLAE